MQQEVLSFSPDRDRRLLRVFPVVPDVLHVVVILEHVEHLLHVLDIVLVRELDVAVLGQHFDLGGEELVALCGQSIGHGRHIVLSGIDCHGLVAFIFKIGGASVERVHHNSVFVQFIILVVYYDNALAVEGPGHAVGSPHVSAIFVKVVAHLTGGTVAIVSHGFNDDSDTLRTVAFVGNLFIVLGVACAEGLVNGTLDIVIGHIGSLGLGNDGGKLGV